MSMGHPFCERVDYGQGEGQSLVPGPQVVLSRKVVGEARWGPV